MAQVQWSELLPELIRSIAQNSITFYEDRLAFAGVCRSWQSAATTDLLPSRFPSLMLAEDTEDTEHRDFFLLSDESIRKLKLPEARGGMCLSSRGWLMIIKEDATAKLLNPLNRRQIHLPNVDTLPDYEEDITWDVSIRKMVLLEEEQLVIVLWGGSSKPGFWRFGDEKWTCITEGWRCMIYDLTYHNNHVYTLDCNAHISECDVHGKDPTTMVHVASIPKHVYGDLIIGAYILGLDKERLLIVIREGMYDGLQDDEEFDYSKCMTKSFHLLEYNLRSQKWSKVNDLGTKALFLGFNSSFWIDARGGANPINANCIYFTDDVILAFYSTVDGGGRDMGIYHLSDGRIEPHFKGTSTSHIAPPLWVESMVPNY